jgi:hypothetical protein
MADSPPRKRLTGRAALNAWPEHCQRCRTERTDESLQRLCGLLDALDHWVVQRWGQKGHQERREALTACRADARECNALEGDLRSDAAQKRGEAGARARAAKKAV